MITQADIDKTHKLAFIHERFGKHSEVAAYSGVQCRVCSSCGMPMSNLKIGSVTTGLDQHTMLWYVDSLIHHHGLTDKTFVMLGTWIQYFVPPAHVGSIMRALVINKQLHTEQAMAEVMMLLDHWAIYHYLFNLRAIPPSAAPHWAQLKQAMLAKSIAADEYRLPFMVAQFIDKVPMPDTWAATKGDQKVNDMYKAWMDKYSTQHALPKGGFI